MDQPPYAELAAFLVAFKEERGVSQSDIARTVKVAPSQVSGWVSGRSRPRPENLERMAEEYALDLDELTRMCRYRSRVDQAPASHAQAELDARLSRLGSTLSKYPRAFWLAVVEASERMAGAGEALVHQLEPPVNGPEEGGVNASKAAQTRDELPPNPPLMRPSRALAGAHSF